MQKELRIIELIESCMRGENTVYLTTAPTAEIKAACRLYRYDDDNAGFKRLEQFYIFKPLISTMECLPDFYCEAKKLFNISETIDIYE